MQWKAVRNPSNWGGPTHIYSEPFMASLCGRHPAYYQREHRPCSHCVLFYTFYIVVSSFVLYRSMYPHIHNTHIYKQVYVCEHHIPPESYVLIKIPILSGIQIIFQRQKTTFFCTASLKIGNSKNWGEQKVVPLHIVEKSKRISDLKLVGT